MRNRLVTILCTALLTLPAIAATRQLTLDDIYARGKRLAVLSPTPKVTWVDDTHFYWTVTEEGSERGVATLVDAVTGEKSALFDAAQLQAEMVKIGVSTDEAKRIATPRTINIDWGSHGLLLTIRGDLYLFNTESKTLTRLTNAPGEEKEATFSPDAKLVAFVRDNDIYTVGIGGGEEKRITTDGSANTLNGALDWVYQEEVYGRGIFKAYWWSPDSKSIAYLKIDESRVPKHTIVDETATSQTVEVQNYPKPGDPNPAATLYVADLASGASRRVDTIADPFAHLIVDVAWRSDSSAVVYQVQDREQTWLDLMQAARSGGEPRRILHETTPAWVDNQGSPFFLADGSMLWTSERSGWKHLYRVAADGTQTPLTSGEWEVRKVFGVDAKNGWIYFSAAKRSPIAVEVYRMKSDRSQMQLLTERAGTHDAAFNDAMTLMTDTWSDMTTPSRIELLAADGKLQRTLYEADTKQLADLDLSKPELVQVKTKDGFVMEGVLIRPPHFDPSKKYPVYEQTYSGPHAPQVANRWGGSTYLWHQLLAQRGIVVWILDNRSASGKGAVSAWTSYKNMGVGELSDLEEGVRWLKEKPWIDSSRVLLNGWSYGGFMTSYALTHSKEWKAGIAGGTVADWHLYDSIYTERVMLTPEHNKEGYARTSPLKSAAGLNGKLLLLHGLIDDNVHVQNTVQLAYELERAGKDFEMLLLPKSRHGVTNPDVNMQMRRRMLDFIDRQLLGK